MTMTTAHDPVAEADWPGVAEVLGEAFAGHVPEADRCGEISTEAFGALREHRLTSALVPVEHGGGGASHAEMGRVLRVLGRSDPATAVTLAMHAHLVAFQVWRQNHGQDAGAVLAKVASGALLISTGASDWVGSNGTSRRVDGGYVVNARKAPASGCEVGDVLVTSVRWEDAPNGPAVLHCSIPMRADGVSIDKTWDTLGLRATGSHTVVLSDVFVPDAAVSLVRPADVWHPVWDAVIGCALPLIMAPYVGIADAATTTALELVQGRRDPHVVQLAGEMGTAHLTGADAVDAMFSSSEDLHFAADLEHTAATLCRKSVAAEALVQAVRLAIETVGGIGYSKATPLERLHRDVHGCLFHPLPRAKQAVFSGRVALGMDPV